MRKICYAWPMNQSKIVKYALAQAVAALVYIGLVAVFLTNLEQGFGSLGERTWVAPFVMLTLFVLSAGVMAVTVFGRALMWYLDGQRREAVNLVVATLGWLAIVVAVVIATLFIR